MAKEIKIRDNKKAVDDDFSTYMLKIYNYMCVALVITGITAIVTVSFDPLIDLFFTLDSNKQLSGLTGFGTLIVFSPLIISTYFFFNFKNVSTAEAQWLFWIYAALIGMSLAQIGLIYTGESIATTFLICASLFAIMSLYGYTTRRDLTSLGSFMFMGLIGIILASLVNLFLKSSSIYFIISLIGIFIFIGLIAWDTQKIRSIYYHAGFEIKPKMAIFGALTLYLDLINLFLHLLRFLGKAKKQQDKL